MTLSYEGHKTNVKTKPEFEYVCLYSDFYKKHYLEV